MPSITLRDTWSALPNHFWNGTASLPLFLTNGRTFSKLTIDNTSMLIASGEAHPFSITRVTADASRLEQRTDLPIVFQFPPAFCIPAKSPDSESRSFHRARYPTVYPFTGHGVHPAHLLTAAGERTGYRGATLLPRNTVGLAVFALTPTRAKSNQILPERFSLPKLRSALP